MEITALLDDDRAVSPVIGVILMVAITVILAAVIGTFVLGLADQGNDSAPQANFQFSYTDSGDGFDGSDADGDKIEITHNGGENVDAADVSVKVGSYTYEALYGSGETGVTSTWPTTVATGDALELTEATGATNYESGDTVRIIWHSPSGGSSSVIGQSQIP